MSKAKHWVTDGRAVKGRCSPTRSCHVMRLALARKTRGPGLDVAMMMHLPTGTAHAVVIYRKAAADSGVAVNFCPFCGADVRLPEERDGLGSWPKRESADLRRAKKAPAKKPGTTRRGASSCSRRP